MGNKIIKDIKDIKFSFYCKRLIPDEYLIKYITDYYLNNKSVNKPRAIIHDQFSVKDIGVINLKYSINNNTIIILEYSIIPFNLLFCWI